MQTALYISLWAYLFTGPLTEPGALLYLVRLVAAKLPMWLYLPLVGCAKCHAGQVALWWQIWQFYKYGEFSLPFVLIAIAGAYALQTWHQIVDKYLHA